MEDTSVLEPATREVAYGVGTLKVTPLKVGQLPAFTRAIRPIFSAIADIITSAPSGGDEGAGGETHLEVDLEKIGGLIADHGDALIDAAAVAVRKPRQLIEDGAPDEFVSLLRAIVEVNVDFFDRAVPREGLAMPAPRVNGAGLTHSSS